MTQDNDEEWNEGRPIALQSRRRRAPLVLAVVVGLVMAGAGGYYFWTNIDRFTQSSGNDTPDRAEPTTGDKAMLTDLLASQQKASEDLDALNQTVTEQQAQLKALADQLAAMTSKVEALQSANVSPPPLAASPQPEAKAPVVPKPAKKPRAKSAGPISVGGAPLDAAPSAGRH
jgi:uncharacterized coiled-coil protein SlyX